MRLRVKENWYFARISVSLPKRKKNRLDSKQIKLLNKKAESDIKFSFQTTLLKIFVLLW